MDTHELLNAALRALRDSLTDALQADSLNEKLGALATLDRDMERLVAARAMVIYEREISR